MTAKTGKWYSKLVKFEGQPEDVKTELVGTYNYDQVNRRFTMIAKLVFSGAITKEHDWASWTKAGFGAAEFDKVYDPKIERVHEKIDGMRWDLLRLRITDLDVDMVAAG